MSTTKTNGVFQLSILSQNDQPNPSCPGCSVGKDIYTFVYNYGGCKFLPPTSSIPNYPASNEKYRELVHLPIPSQNPPPTPTWYFELTDSLDDAWIDVCIITPGYRPRFITIDGSNMRNWIAQSHNGETPTNQIYQHGNCGIIGYAQENAGSSDQPDFWIYTLTAGICNPQVHPGR